MPLEYTHRGPHQPSPLVHTFLGRPRPARSTRGLADHLAPRPAAPRPAPRPAPTQPPRPTATPQSPPVTTQPSPRPATTQPRPAPTQPPRPPVPQPADPPPPVAEVGAPRVSEKVTVLDRERPVTTLRAPDRTGGTVRATLTWRPQLSRAGVRLSTDVHLGCLWELRDGPAGIVQDLGGTFSAPGFGARQVLRLGPRSEEAGEELLLDLRHVDALRRMVLFATGRRGRPDWAALDAVLTVRLPPASGCASPWTHRPDRR